MGTIGDSSSCVIVVGGGEEKAGWIDRRTELVWYFCFLPFFSLSLFPNVGQRGEEVDMAVVIIIIMSLSFLSFLCFFFSGRTRKIGRR